MIGHEFRRRAQQAWNVGDVVNVGFLKGLTVMERIPTPGDYRPDVYRLISSKGVTYEFTPHFGITKVS